MRESRKVLELPGSFKAKAEQPDLESDFEQLWKRMTKNWPIPVREFTFHKTRKWRFDFAWTRCRVAVEIEGAIHSRGRHTRGKGYQADLEKYNAATEAGWAVLRYSATDLKKWPMSVIEQIQAVLYLKGIKQHGL
jgi:very-short-patch-repair endonuclease